MRGPWPDWEQDVIDGRFPLLQWLGSSDHSQVFRTEHRLNSATIKLVPSRLVSAQTELTRWLAAASLKQPHLISLLDYGHCRLHEQEYLFVAMEYADETLSEILPLRALHPEEVQGLLGPVLDALAFLHERGWVHARVQPTNILVVGDQIKLAGDTAVRASTVSLPVRTSLYDPPDASRLTAAADVWALGVTLIEALTQHAPLPQTAEAPALPDGLPVALSHLIQRCVRIDPADRPTTPALWAELTGLERAPVLLPAPATPTPPAAPTVPTAPALPSVLSVPAVPAATRSGATSPTESRSRAWWPGAAVLAGVGIIGAIALHFASSGTSGRLREARTTPAASAPADTPANPPTTAPTTPLVAATGAPPRASAERRVASAAPPAPVAAAAAAAIAAPAGSADVRHQELPSVPQHSANTIHGHFDVVVRVLVDSSGQVIGAALDRPGPSPYFARLSASAARRWTFVRSGSPEPRAWRLVFQYSRDGVKAHEESAGP